MLDRKKKYSIISIRTLVIAILIISFAIPVFIGNLKVNPHIDYTPSEDALSTSEFIKDNYSAIIPNDDYGLGSVSIDEMHFDFYLNGLLNNTAVYPLLDADLFSGALKPNVTRVEFIETIEPAIRDNLNRTNRRSITVKLNETMDNL